MQRIYAARGVVSGDELEYSLSHLLQLDSLAGAQSAAVILAEALQRNQRIIFVGDFDADGATSTALGVLALRMFGAAYVDYIVPNRFEFGYGLSPEIVDVALSRKPDVLITVDNGIASIDGVKAAKRAGLQVIVTDHHLAGAELPEADAIVNPNQPGCDFPSKSIAGVGVIFYVMLALRQTLRDKGWFAATGMIEPNLANLLDLVALGTVADVVSLDANNRILVEQGLRRIRVKRCRPGINALLQVAGRNQEKLGASDLGFSIAPRLNAAGRLEDMTVGIELLLTEDPAKALMIAQELDGLNQARKEIERDMQAQALSILDRMNWTYDNPPAAVCLYDESWHQGVVGILASRIKDRLHRPVIAFAPGDNGELKGSARSIPGLHIRDALDAVATRRSGLLSKFGGHAMAAGLSLRPENFTAFSEAFQEVVAAAVSVDDLQAKLLTDGELSPEELCMNMAIALKNAGPWGQSFPEPLFDGQFRIASCRIVGERHLKMALADSRSGNCYDAICFNIDPATPFSEWDRVKVVFRLDINEFRGHSNLQLLIEYLEPCN
ncbi:single-stranded-DNA-specific exonuclease RecJ [Hahella chejuensis KCTC 2396]|uniref:Single-stranded-DNA-specific exonuclease RecJ n=1 Tax=Hahella chejuensis (strain KCTC 2396) TaxID=349521 RepID=Q2SL49_HAHCH|nr:single-stranded-DNA-specific exonuclease RecJ [Hahella chejuensis KCTC 2396]